MVERLLTPPRRPVGARGGIVAKLVTETLEAAGLKGTGGAMPGPKRPEPGTAK
jgi:hypothetical protein